jgi:ubiquinone/menaquinone biosynthesis C-methylase UbiE
MPYDPGYLRRYYDKYGQREWVRLERGAEAEVNFHIHQHYLLRYIQRGQRVLEIGPGPGRFTLELAACGAKVVALDISPEQLRLNRERMVAEGQADVVEKWVEGDVTDLSRFAPEEFDAVVCYGGPLSYVFEAADQALAEMLRVVKAGGYILLSVMSLLGTTRRFIGEIVELSFQYGMEEVDRVSRTGNLTGDVARGHYCHMYRWSELQRLFAAHRCEVVAASASGYLVLQDKEAARIARSEPALWDAFLAWEVMYCREPGAIDGGTHIIAVLRKPR